MLPMPETMRAMLTAAIASRDRNGFAVDGLAAAVADAGDSLDALAVVAQRLAAAPHRADWPWHEPDDLEGIRGACPEWPVRALAAAPADAGARAAEGFRAAIAGCVLGKPLEVDPTCAELERAAVATGTAFPFTGYIAEPLLAALGRRHGSWIQSARERVVAAPQDDDLNFTLLGLLMLERHGPGFDRHQLIAAWMRNLPALQTFGSERVVYVQALLDSLRPWMQSAAPPPAEVDAYGDRWNPREEGCGAAIRVHAYGLACPGDPGRAAELAWRDGRLTHRRTGIYAGMAIAAWIAAAAVVRDWRAIADAGLAVVPRRSRLHHHLAWARDEVAASAGWREAHARIHARLGGYGHCQVHQELASMLVTLRFAADPGAAIGMQVAQGMDTDSFGCASGALAGVRFGAGSLDPAWLAPLNDRIEHPIAELGEWRIEALAERMARLPALAATPAMGGEASASRDAATGL